MSVWKFFHSLTLAASPEKMFIKRKIFIYVITLTATLLLVAFCILILIKNKNFEKENSLDISFPPKNFYENNYGCSLEKILSFRNFTTYNLTNNENEDKILFKQIQISVRKLIKSNDSENGILIKFNQKTKYGDVIKLLDICQIEKVPTYLVNNYDIWIMTGKNLELEKNCPFKYHAN